MSGSAKLPRATLGKSSQRGDFTALLKLSDVAKILGVSPKTLQRRIKAGDLPVIRDGRVIRVHPDDLRRYVASRRSL